MTKKIALIMALPSESQGLFEKANIPVHYCGIGKINAAQKTTEVILKEKPDYIINLGTAGSNRFATHELVQVSKTVQRDMDLTPLGFALGDTPMDSIGSGIELEPLLKNLKQGVCGTGDNFETGQLKLPCDLVDMEVYAIAKVCKKYQIPLISIKYITDGSDDQAHKDWAENLKPASEKLLSTYELLVSSLK